MNRRFKDSGGANSIWRSADERRPMIYQQLSSETTRELENLIYCAHSNTAENNNAQSQTNPHLSLKRKMTRTTEERRDYGINGKRDKNNIYNDMRNSSNNSYENINNTNFYDNQRESSRENTRENYRENQREIKPEDLRKFTKNDDKRFTNSTDNKRYAKTNDNKRFKLNPEHLRKENINKFSRNKYENNYGNKNENLREKPKEIQKEKTRENFKENINDKNIYKNEDSRRNDDIRKPDDIRKNDNLQKDEDSRKNEEKRINPEDDSPEKNIFLNKNFDTNFDKNDENNILCEKDAFVKAGLLNLNKYSAFFNTHAFSELLNLIRRPEIERNKLGEDIELLTILMFDGINFQCPVCKVACAHCSTMQENHLKSAQHLKNVKTCVGPPIYEKLITNPFSQAFFENETVRKSFNDMFSFLPSISDFDAHFSYGSGYTLNVYTKPDEKSIIISQDSKSTVVVKDRFFESFYGESFVKPVSGFRCCICFVFISHGNTETISRHLCSKMHQDNLKKYILKNRQIGIGLADRSIVKELLNSGQNKVSRVSNKCELKSLPFAINSSVFSGPVSGIGTDAVSGTGTGTTTVTGTVSCTATRESSDSSEKKIPVKKPIIFEEKTTKKEPEPAIESCPESSHEGSSNMPEYMYD